MYGEQVRRDGDDKIYGQTGSKNNEPLCCHIKILSYIHVWKKQQMKDASLTGYQLKKKYFKGKTLTHQEFFLRN